MQNEVAYNSMLATHQFEADNFPMEVTENVKRLIDEGVMYIFGRDKFFRPLYVLSLSKLLLLNPASEPSDLIKLIYMMNEFTESHMLVPGHIENRTVIIDCKDMWIWNLPSTIM